jgi:hypothetical protein
VEVVEFAGDEFGWKIERVTKGFEVFKSSDILSVVEPSGRIF